MEGRARRWAAVARRARAYRLAVPASVPAATVVALVVGWMFAPNAFVPGDSPVDHVRFALAAAIAATAAALVVGPRGQPGWRTTLSLALVTLALGPLALLLTGTEVGVANPLDGRDYRPNVIVAALGVPVWPAVAAGVCLWAAAMPAISRSTAAETALARLWHRFAPLVAAFIVIVVAVAAFGGQIHRFGSNLQDPPAPVRPQLVGVIQKAPFFGPADVVLVLDDGREVHSPTNGRALDGHVAPIAGDLYFSGAGWYDALQKNHLEMPDCWGLMAFTPGSNVAWDRGGRILLPNGLELPKAPGFADNGRARRYLGETLYRPSEGLCINSKGQVWSANDVQGLP